MLLIYEGILTVPPSKLDTTTNADAPTDQRLLLMIRDRLSGLKEKLKTKKIEISEIEYELPDITNSKIKFKVIDNTRLNKAKNKAKPKNPSRTYIVSLSLGPILLATYGAAKMNERDKNSGLCAAIGEQISTGKFDPCLRTIAERCVQASGSN